MSNKLQKVMQLAKKTGDRIVVFDNSLPDDSYVVMPLNEYEEILGLNKENGEKSVLTGEKGNDTIVNSENQMWKNDSGFPKENIYSSAQVIKDKMKGNNNWSIPKEIKEVAEKEATN